MIKFQFPKKPKAIQGSASAPEFQAAENFSQPSEGYKDLNFKVSEKFRRTYKTASAVKGISMVDILRESFQLWADKNGFQAPDRE